MFVATLYVYIEADLTRTTDLLYLSGMNKYTIRYAIDDLDDLKKFGNGNILTDEYGTVIKPVLKPDDKIYNQAIDDVKKFLFERLKIYE